MRQTIRIRGKTRELEIARAGDRLLCRLDGRQMEADAIEVTPGIYSIILEGRAFDVRVESAEGGLRIHAGTEEFPAEVIDPRQWQGRRSHVIEAEGRQQVAAPMPGKIVRVLVTQGETVEAGQGLVVVEAMKMQNEIKSPKTGTVERLLVIEGKAVNAGEVVAVVA